MHTAAALSQQRSPKMTLRSESELARGPCQGRCSAVSPRWPTARQREPLSCRSQVSLEHCVDRVMQQQLRHETRRPQQQLGELGLFHGFKGLVHPKQGRRALIDLIIFIIDSLYK